VIVVNDVEAIMTTLENLLMSVTTPQGPIATVTRVWQPWDQIANIAQPAIVITEPGEEQTDRRGQQPSLKLNVKLVCYVQTDPKDALYPPNTRVNNLISGIRAAMLPRSGRDKSLNVQSLDGLVSNCYIDGKILKDAGIIDNQGSALIPVTVLIS
jgi:hypothetical protein